MSEERQHVRLIFGALMLVLLLALLLLLLLSSLLSFKYQTRHVFDKTSTNVTSLDMPNVRT